MAKVMVVMDGRTVDYSLMVNLLRSGFDVSWASDPEMASLMARASPPDAFVVDGRSSDRPVSDIRAELGALLGGAELPTIALVCEPGGCGLDVRFDMRQGEQGSFARRMIVPRATVHVHDFRSS